MITKWKQLAHDVLKLKSATDSKGKWTVQVNEKDTSIECPAWAVAFDVSNCDAEFIVWCHNNIDAIVQALYIADASEEQK